MANDDLSLTASRTFVASPQSVFSAWTDPDGLWSWWEPGGTTVESAQIDLRVGGLYQIQSTAPQRNLTIIISGTYQDVNIPHSLAYTWTWQEASDTLLVKDSLVTVNFNALDTQTQIFLVHTGFPSLLARNRHLDGWQQTLESFSSYLSTRKQG